MAVGHCVRLVNYELGCELGGNRGLTSIVIVIVIECHFFFSQKWHPDFCSFGYNYNRRLLSFCLRSGFALPSLWLHSRSGGKVDSKWDEKALDITYPFVG